MNSGTLTDGSTSMLFPSNEDVPVSDESVDGLVTLTEWTVNLIKQLNMPLVEVSLVIANTSIS